MSSGVTAAHGFRAAAVEAGIKPGCMDLALLASDRPCVASGVFTTNLAKAAPVACEGGAARAYDEALAHAAMLEDPGRLTVHLHAGDAAESMWMCDLARSYVDINAHYRT